MPQNTPRPSLSRKAGRGFLRALRELFGDRNVRRAAQSLEVLKSEYAAGREDSKPDEPLPRPIPHRELEARPGSSETREPRPAP